MRRAGSTLNLFLATAALALPTPSLAVTLVVNDPAGQPLATAMVRERPAGGPNLDTSDNGYQAPGVARTVAFPGCDITADLGPDAPRELAIDASDLREPTAALHRVRKHWGTCPPVTQELVAAVVPSREHRAV